MEVQDLNYFIALASSELHFGRTAELLDIDQPVLSNHIKRLERDLNFRLIDRTTRPLQLTPAGIVFLSDVPDIVQQLERAKRRAYRASRGEIGQLVIGSNSSIANSLLPNILRVFRGRRPDVKQIIRELAPQEQIHQLLNYQIDIGFEFLPHDEHHPDLESMPILSEPLVVALPESHPLVAYSEIPLLALKDELFIFPSSKEVRFYQQIINFCEQVFGHKPKIAQEGTWLLTVLSLVSAELGISLVLQNAQNIQRQGVVYRPIAGFNLEIQLATLWRDNDESIILREFRELVREIAGN